MIAVWDDEDEVSALGTVLERGRGSLPFALIHGESLVVCASLALTAAGVTAIDDSVPWVGVVEADELFVLHDCLCPLTPGEFIASCVQTALDEDVTVVGVRAVTDTVKEVTGGLVGVTVDREALLEVWSPIVLPAAVCAAIADPMAMGVAELVASLIAAGHRVLQVPAPVQARRVGSRDDLRVLAAVTTP